MRNPLTYIKPYLAKNEPAILIAMGVSGLVFSTVWAIKATFDSAKAIENYKQSKGIDKLTKKEYFNLTWKKYLPVVISTAVSIPCIIAGNRVSTKRYAALATAYTISETALQEYQEKTRELVGEKKEKEIRDSISADKVEKTFKNDNSVIIVDKGESLFLEPVTGRYFKSNWNDINKAANELNAEALGSMAGQITLNEWFEKIGLPDTDVGYILGWELDGNPSNLICVEIASALTPDHIPCGAISYKRQPTKLKDSLY